MKRVTLYSGGKIVQQWKANDVAFHQDSCSFYDADSPKLDLVQISGTISVERTHEDKYGKAKE